MTLIDRLGAALPRAPVTIELDDIQATVLRYRPEPYYGTHVMLHVADAQGGRAFLRRLAPHIDSAADWWQAGESWISVAISYTGLVALGVPEDSLQSFPEAFRVGMAARAGQLLRPESTSANWWAALATATSRPSSPTMAGRPRSSSASRSTSGSSKLPKKSPSISSPLRSKRSSRRAGGIPSVTSRGRVAPGAALTDGRGQVQPAGHTGLRVLGTSRRHRPP